MKRTLIIDAGGTKCRWHLLPGDFEFETAGLNLASAAEDTIGRVIGSAAERLAAENLSAERICFYGAGCGSPEAAARFTVPASEAFGTPDAEAHSDMLGAARALFGNRPGIACILGTGSNSSLYDGKELTVRIPPLGYILGDEGSGAYLGKQLLKAVFRHTLPENVCRSFTERYRLDEAEAIRRVYRCEGANTFLGSLTPFLKENIEIPEVREIVMKAFREFREASVEPYFRENLHTEGSNHLEIGIVGSIALHFRPELTEALTPHILRILPDPMPGLVAYHTAVPEI